MATIWITYSWKDNKNRDVDFLAQELQAAGLVVKLDRWALGAGRRLWEQIEKYIQDPSESDAWLVYVTQNSLGSEPCREEFAWALDRALRSRTETFPVIALFSGAVDSKILPAALRTRLCVAATDPDWKERIKAAAERRGPQVSELVVQPFHIARHVAADGRHVVEVRPRAGTWAPFIAAIPVAEKGAVKLSLLHGPSGRVPMGGVLFSSGEETQAQWHLAFAANEATPTMSYFIFCAALPSQLHFRRGPWCSVHGHLHPVSAMTASPYPMQR